MHRIFASVLFMVCSAVAFGGNSTAWGIDPKAAPVNGCVRCHSRLSLPSEMSDRFLDWRMSRHAAAGITCDKCHGGEPRESVAEKAHTGVYPPSNSNSMLNERKSPDTCSRCHGAVVHSFIESRHYSLLKAAEGGPSCISCHGHKSSSVARAPAEANALCTFCHNAINGPLPQRPDIVRTAKSTLDAIARTNYMVVWIDELLVEARRKKLNVKAEEEDFRLLKLTLTEAKAGWHTFTLQKPAMKAEKSFDEAIRVKNNLSKKLGID